MLLERVYYYFVDLFSVEVRSAKGDFIDSIKVDLSGKASDGEIKKLVQAIYGTDITEDDQRTLASYINEYVRSAYQSRQVYGMAY